MLRSVVASAFALIGLTSTADEPEPTLAALAHRAGLLFGSAVQARSLAEPNLTALLVRECNTLTPELEFKWDALSPEPGLFNFAGADAIAAFARTNGVRLRGHTLLWHGGLPQWINADTPWEVVRGHIGTVMARYGDLVDEWDVVNEPIVGTGLRDGVLLRSFGSGYIEQALREAHMVAPNARLMINDYDLEYPIAEQANRRAAMFALLRTLRRRSAPLHGVGLQGHLSLARGAIDAAVLRDYLSAVADLGLSISITELDVKELDYTASADMRDSTVADHVARFLEVMLAQPAVRSLTCWGLSDRQSWLKITAEDRARFPNAWQDATDPGFNRGLPYDAALVAKPMRSSIKSALAAHERR